MKEFLEKYGLGNNTDAATELATLLLREYRSGYQDAKERWQGDCTPWYATGQPVKYTDEWGNSY